jgi:hypothetical protein
MPMRAGDGMRLSIGIHNSSDTINRIASDRPHGNFDHGRARNLK